MAKAASCWVVDSRPVVLLQPGLPQMVGKQVGDYKDPAGKLVYGGIVDAARATGRGYVEYLARLPHSETTVQKVSYVIRFAPWDWNIARAACSSRTSTRRSTAHWPSTLASSC